MMTQSDNELVKAINKGEQGAFKIIYDRYSDLLFTYIMHHLNNDKEMASDIWQDTWIVAVEKSKDFKSKSSFFTWLCAIAKNKISDYYRNAKKEEQFERIEKMHFDIDDEELNIELIDSKTQVEVITVLGSLEELYRDLLIAKYIDNKSIDEISTEMGKSYKATESLLSRSREAFRKEFNLIKR